MPWTQNMLLCGASAVASGASWTPASFPNQVGWWRAKDIAGKSDGDSVTAWPDSFGVQSDATGTGTYKTGANGINSQPAILFNGSSDYYDTGYSGTPTDFFAWAVFDVQDTGYNGRIFSKDDTNGFDIARRHTGSDVILFIRGSAEIIASSTPGFAAVGRNGTSGSFLSNATTNTKTVSGTALSSTTMIIGRFVTATAYNSGLIAECGIISSYPSAGELTSFKTYINSEYGITTS